QKAWVFANQACARAIETAAHTAVARGKSRLLRKHAGTKRTKIATAQPTKTDQTALVCQVISNRATPPIRRPQVSVRAWPARRRATRREPVGDHAKTRSSQLPKVASRQRTTIVTVSQTKKTPGVFALPTRP